MMDTTKTASVRILMIAWKFLKARIGGEVMTHPAGCPFPYTYVHNVNDIIQI